MISVLLYSVSIIEILVATGVVIKAGLAKRKHKKIQPDPELLERLGLSTQKRYEFLSPEWLQALREAQKGKTTAIPVRVGFLVTQPNKDEIKFAFDTSTGSFEFDMGKFPDNPDFILKMDIELAKRILVHEDFAGAAFAYGTGAFVLQKGSFSTIYNLAMKAKNAPRTHNGERFAEVLRRITK